MEVSSSSIPRHDIEETALKGLLQAFGSLFSLEEIVSAYRKAGRNADIAGKILYYTQGSTGGGESAEPANPTITKNASQTYGKPKPAKQKWRPVSGGIVSSVVGKDYLKPMPASPVPTKPLKLDGGVLPITKICPSQCCDTSGLNMSKNEHLHHDVEDFVFKMLGNGFNLERDVIHQVLDKCGFDVQRGMDNLLDLSGGTSNKEEALGESSRKDCLTAKPLLRDAFPNPEGPALPAEVQLPGSVGRDNAKSPGRDEERDIRQSEVLTSLFHGTQEKIESSRRKPKPKTRSLALGKLVVPTEMDFDLEEPKSISVSKPQDTDKVTVEEDSYEQLLKAVKEYRVTMKEYYKAAVDAFVKGDYERANKLMDKGHFFCQKAREADEESTQKIFETNNSAELQDEMLLDLHNHGPREARRLLKCHLSTLSAFNHLKVIIETNEVEDTTKGMRRRLVMKLLESKSITWSKGDADGTILIHLDSVNQKGLSFTMK